MKIQLVFRFLAVLLVVMVTLAAAGPVSAGGNTHIQTVENRDLYYSLVVGDPDLPSPCDFNILVHEVGQFRVNLWVDENGNPVKMFEIYGNLKKDWSANGKTLNDQFQGPVHYQLDYQPEQNVLTVQVVGATEIFTIPGYGIVSGGGGQTVEIYTYDAATWDEIGYSVIRQNGNVNYNPGPVCDYLSP